MACGAQYVLDVLAISRFKPAISRLRAQGLVGLTRAILKPLAHLCMQWNAGCRVGPWFVCYVFDCPLSVHLHRTRVFSCFRAQVLERLARVLARSGASTVPVCQCDMESCATRFHLTSCGPVNL